jgi:uncharacterized protein (DUF608 family)
MAMPRECNCAGGCGPQESRVTRRDFITLVGAGSAGVLLGGPAWADWVAQQASPETLAQWKADLFKPAPPRRYRSDTHADARMHLGGIGTGNFEIGADGQFTTWQLFNTLRDGYVPFYFAVKAGNGAKLLQTAGGPGWPHVASIEMTGEYPFTTLRFTDPDLPVHLELTAFTPFAPLDTRLSSLPVACFTFRIHNPTGRKQSVSLAAFLQNAIGYDAMGVPISFNSVGFNSVPERMGVEHPNFGGNFNHAYREGRGAVLAMESMPGAPPQLDTAVHLITNADPRGLNTPPNDRPHNLSVSALDALARPQSAESADARMVVWLEEAPADLPAETLRAARAAVEAGGLLVFSGKTMPLLETYAQFTGGKPFTEAAARPDVVFEDFENGYGNWKVEGTAFGTGPARGTLPGQQAVSGFLGKGLVNSFAGGDDTTGRLTSRPFKIERSYIRFLVGGGSHPTTQIRLLVDGKIVRATSGRNDERLLPALWDVRALQGKQAHIEIVDEQKGGWGHINVDQIAFSDLPGSLESLTLLEDLLPARFQEVRPHAAQSGKVEFTGLQRHPEAHVRADKPQGLTLLERPVGKGRVILADGAILEAAQAELIGARQQAYVLLCTLAGARYTPPQGVLASAPGFGALALMTTGSNPTSLPAFDNWQSAWEKFAHAGGFQPVEEAGRSAPTAPGRTVNGGLASTVDVPPGKTVEVPFFLAWHYPNKYNGAGVPMGNHYAREWKDVGTVLREVAADYPKLRERSERFRKTFYDSTLPYWMLDCLTSQLSTIRHVGVVFRTANGDVFGWEGSNGCCQPTCTHVWGYMGNTARVFPELEREMRRIDFKHQQNPDGGVNNRTEVPSPPHPTGERPFSDGHCSTVLKAYREALNYPDDSWLKEYWPGIKKAVEYLIGRDAATSGGQPDGTLSDDQWNTYDNAIHGVNTFIGSYYLAALRAGEEMAKRMGEPSTANRFHSVFEKGQKKLVELCWNGEYFQQHLPDYLHRDGEYGPGCLSDQLIGQWWAHQLGLGYILPEDKVKTALKSIYKYNWLPDFRNFQHNWRKFAGGKDKGLLICTWPKGGRPANTIPYVDEVWTGVEYQVAAHMAYEGMLEEALSIVKGARDRYDGVPRAPMPRNPWNEIECGGHYARAGSSWLLLLAMSGWQYDGMTGSLQFAPRYKPENFKSFFSGPEGWGSLKQTRKGKTQHNEIQVLEGSLRVTRLQLQPASAAKSVRVMHVGNVLGARLEHNREGVIVIPIHPITVQRGERLIVDLA